MIIYKYDVYLDGGTIGLETDEGLFYIDNRIKTNTRGRVFGAYPNDRILPMSEDFKYKILGATMLIPKDKNLDFLYRRMVKLLLRKNYE